MCSGRSGAKSYAAPMVVVDGQGVCGVGSFVNLSAQCGQRRGTSHLLCTATKTPRYLDRPALERSRIIVGPGDARVALVLAFTLNCPLEATLYIFRLCRL